MGGHTFAARGSARDWITEPSKHTMTNVAAITMLTGGVAKLIFAVSRVPVLEFLVTPSTSDPGSPNSSIR